MPVLVNAVGEDSDTLGVDNGINEQAESSGAAYVFKHNLGEWSQQAFLKASNTQATDWFGSAVDIYDDTIVVSALHEDSNTTIINGDESNDLASSSGALYVYTRTVNTWSQQAYLKPFNTGSGDQFGYSLSISNDVVVVGARYEASSAVGVGGNQSNDDASESGAAYIFKRSAGNWSQQAYLKASNTGLGDQFGYSVAIDHAKVIVGAQYEDSDAQGVDGDENNDFVNDSGAAYVFNLQAGIWSQQAYFKASNTASNNVLGFSVAVSGDNMIVGSRWESSNSTGVNNDDSNTSGPFSGAVYVFNEKPIFVNGFE